MSQVYRCPWARGELYERYHDEEWGVPSHDDSHLFEMITLEGAQAGLSWSTILNRREGYREGSHADEKFLAGVRLLGDLGMRFDLLTGAENLPDAETGNQIVASISKAVYDAWAP